MSGYVPDPTDLTQPTGTVTARTAAAEFRALKAFVATLANTEPTWNPLDKAFFIGLVSGNLTPIGVDATNTLNGLVRATQGRVGAQKYYLEHTIGSSVGNVEMGVATLSIPVFTGGTTHLGTDLFSIGYRSDGSIWYGGVAVTSVSPFAPFDIIGVEFSETGSVTFYRNGVLLYTQAWDASATFYPKYPMAGLALYNDYIVTNFGVTPFTYPVPVDAVPFFEQSTPISGPQNLIVNSDMYIDARNAHTALIPVVSGNFLADRWAYYGSVAGAFNAISTLCTDADQQATQGCLAFQRLTVAATAVPGAAEFFMITQRVEGVRLGRLLWGTANAKAVTLSFYVRSSVANIFTVALQNGARTRSFLSNFEITLAQINTWQRINVVIPGCTDGAWNLDTGLGIDVILNLGAGANYQGPASGTWTAADDRQGAGATAFVSKANGSSFDFTGVELRPGYYNVSTPREIIDPSVQAIDCQRYFYKRDILNAGYINAAITISQHLALPAPMRDVPTGVISANANTNCANSTFTALTTSAVIIGSVGVALGGFIQRCVVSITAEI